MSDINALKRERWAKTIDQLVADATTKKYCTDGLYWRPIYDFGHAPMTTNLQQLNEIGIVPVSLENLTAQETIEALQLIIRGLAKLGVFWLHTNHLADAEFYECLMSKIMVQPVRDLSFDAGVREFIDLTGWQSEVPVVDVCERDERLPKPIAPSGSSVNATIGGCWCGDVVAVTEAVVVAVQSLALSSPSWRWSCSWVLVRGRRTHQATKEIAPCGRFLCESA